MTHGLQSRDTFKRSGFNAIITLLFFECEYLFKEVSKQMYVNTILEGEGFWTLANQLKPMTAVIEKRRNRFIGFGQFSKWQRYSQNQHRLIIVDW